MQEKGDLFFHPAKTKRKQKHVKCLSLKGEAMILDHIPDRAVTY